jgi:hypothetical protein
VSLEQRIPKTVHLHELLFDSSHSLLHVLSHKELKIRDGIHCRVHARGGHVLHRLAPSLRQQALHPLLRLLLEVSFAARGAGKGWGALAPVRGEASAVLEGRWDERTCDELPLMLLPLRRERIQRTE